MPLTLLGVDLGVEDEIASAVRNAIKNEDFGPNYSKIIICINKDSEEWRYRIKHENPEDATSHKKKKGNPHQNWFIKLLTNIVTVHDEAVKLCSLYMLKNLPDDCIKDTKK